MSELHLNDLQKRILKFLAKQKASGHFKVINKKILEKFSGYDNLQVSLNGLRNELLILRSHDYPSPSYTYEITVLGEEEIT